MIQYHQNALSQLNATLVKLRTPKEIVATIEHGLLAWASFRDHPGYAIHAPTRGSVRPTDVLLTQAFHEQTLLGWNQFLCGRISRKWGTTYRAFRVQGKQFDVNVTAWAKPVILTVWDCTSSLWKHRNGIVHGTRKEEQIQKTLEGLKAHVSAAYNEYSKDPFIVSSK